jgi:outer membrane murein-binding lipoprotein Lpp
LPWKSILAAVVALGLGVGIGLTAQGDTEVENLRAQVTDLEEQLEAAQEQALAAENAAAEAEENLADELAEFEQREDELGEREDELDEREDELQEAEQRQESSTFGDGIWQVGIDFPPGLYRSPGGSGCYWALLRSANTNAIISNGGFSANQTLQIDSPFFQTADCGEWQKIG